MVVPSGFDQERIESSCEGPAAGAGPEVASGGTAAAGSGFGAGLGVPGTEVILGAGVAVPDATAAGLLWKSSRRAAPRHSTAAVALARTAMATARIASVRPRRRGSAFPMTANSGAGKTAWSAAGGAAAGASNEARISSISGTDNAGSNRGGTAATSKSY